MDVAGEIPAVLDVAAIGGRHRAHAGGEAFAFLHRQPVGPLHHVRLAGRLVVSRLGVMFLLLADQGAVGNLDPQKLREVRSDVLEVGPALGVHSPPRNRVCGVIGRGW